MGSWELVPGLKDCGVTEAKCATEIDDFQARVEKLRSEFGRSFVRRGEESRLCPGRENIFDGKLADRRAIGAPQLWKEFREAVSALRVAHIKGGSGAGRMAEQELSQLKARISGNTYDGDGIR